MGFVPKFHKNKSSSNSSCIQRKLYKLSIIIILLLCHNFIQIAFNCHFCLLIEKLIGWLLTQKGMKMRIKFKDAHYLQLKMKVRSLSKLSISFS